MTFAIASRFGQTGANFAAFDHSGINTFNEVGVPTALVPHICRIWQIGCYFAGDGATVTARCAAWDGANGNLLNRSGQFTAPAGNESTGGQNLNVQPVDGPGPILGTDRSLYIGFWRAPGGSGVWSVLAAGIFGVQTDLSGDVGSFAGNTACGAAGFVCGDLQRFVDLAGGDMATMASGFAAFLSGRRRHQRRNR